MATRDDFERLRVLAQAKENEAASAIMAAVRPYVLGAVRTIDDGASPKSYLDQVENEMIKDLQDAKRPRALTYAVYAYRYAAFLVGREGFENVEAKALAEMTEYELLIARHLETRVDEWIIATSKIETATTAAQIDGTYKRMLKTMDPEKFSTRRDLEKALAQNVKNAAVPMTENRSKMMARTLTNWSYNEGAMVSYLDAGIDTVEWSATLDDRTGEWDAELDGKKIQTGTNFVASGDTFVASNPKGEPTVITAPFDVPHPPLHPNCRCVLIPVVESL